MSHKLGIRKLDWGRGICLPQNHRLIQRQIPRRRRKHELMLDYSKQQPTVLNSYLALCIISVLCNKKSCSGEKWGYRHLDGHFQPTPTSSHLGSRTRRTLRWFLHVKIGRWAKKLVFSRAYFFASLAKRDGKALDPSICQPQASLLSK